MERLSSSKAVGKYHFGFILSKETVLFSEGPLSEISLYHLNRVLVQNLNPIIILYRMYQLQPRGGGDDMEERPSLTIRTSNGTVIPPPGYCLSENQKIGLHDTQFIGKGA